MALTYQGFFDDSETPGGGEYVLAGHVATAEAWSKFTVEWERLLPFTMLGKTGRRRFKMVEMATSKDRMKHVPAFYRAIEAHVAISISARMNNTDFSKAIERFYSWSLAQNWSVNLGRWSNPYYFLWHVLMDDCHRSRDEFASAVPAHEPIDFIFDEHSQKQYIVAQWDDYLEELAADGIAVTGRTPRFEDDEDFMQLQAADLWAWWVRKWYEEDAVDLPQRLKEADFGAWRGGKLPRFAISCSEDRILEKLQFLALSGFAERR